MAKTNEPFDLAEREDREISNSKYFINSYGADYTVDSLVQRLKRGDIIIPSFQRKYVWTFNQACRFIESLLLGLPVPGVFFSKDEDRCLLVIDGQQRLITLQRFYGGIFEKREFALRNVVEQFEGKTYETLASEDRRQLDDSIIHSTIIQQTLPDDSSIYHIFERLNTGGTNLQPQEIRASLYHGPFNDLLNELNNYSFWRQIYGPKSRRAKDQELILRFFALLFDFEQYKRPMNEFLNAFMSKHRKIDERQQHELAELFRQTVDVVWHSIGENALRPQRGINAAVYDAVMIGIASRLRKGRISDLGGVKDQYELLLQVPDFVIAYSSATTDLENVRTRIALAVQAFSQLV